MPPTVYGYGRASTHEQVETLIAQKDKIEKEYQHRFKDEGLEWGGVYLDPGVSGGKCLSNRPQGFKLLQALKKGDVVIITKLDRGFRNTADLIQTIERWSLQGVRLITLDHNVDTGTPVGRLFLRILAIFAEFERDRISERIQDTINSLRARGIHVGQAPYGYINKKGRLVSDVHLRRIACKIIELTDSQNMTVHEIYWHLRRHDVKRANGSEISTGSINRYYHQEKALQLAEQKQREAEAEEEEVHLEATEPAG